MVKIDFDRPGLDSDWGAAHKYWDGFPTDSANMGPAEWAEICSDKRVDIHRELQEDVEFMTVLAVHSLCDYATTTAVHSLMTVLAHPGVPADEQNKEQLELVSVPECEKRPVEECLLEDQECIEQASKRTKTEEIVEPTTSEETEEQLLRKQEKLIIETPGCWSFFQNLFKPTTSSRPNLQSGDQDLQRALLESASLTEAKSLSIALARVRLQGVMDKFQARARPVEADGNCQFRALALQLHGDEDQHAKVRSGMVEWLQRERERYCNFVYEPYDDFMKRMACDGEWGDNVTLQAISDMLCRDIHILNDTPGAEHISVHPADKVDDEKADKPKALWLAFLAEVHYDAIEFV